MSHMKSVARSATVAFSPTVPDLVALGASAGSLDASFTSHSSLDVFQVDFSSPHSDLDLLSSYEANDEFHRLSWGTAGVGGEAHPYGLLAGALADGAVCVWDPAPLIRKENVDSALLSKMHKHVGRVRGLDFSVVAPNLLASGGDDGDIFVWDLQDPTSPSHFPPLKAAGQEHIVDLSWNSKVQHIMATTSNSGATVVWDLRKQRSVVSIADPNNRRACAAVEWNPDVATQLIVASADDDFPKLQVWDLRNSISPVKQLTGHTKGIVTMAWCPLDSGILLSSGKDCRTLCWDTFSAEIICELPANSNWTFDVQWSPTIAGVFSTSSYDGQVNLYNIEACKKLLPSDRHFGAPLGASMRAPKWLQRPVGLCFGFGGKLASSRSSTREVKIETFITQKEIVSRAKEIESIIKDPANRYAFQEFCQQKVEKSGSENKKELWNFVKFMFEENVRTSLLNHLGYSLPDVKDNVHENVSRDGVEENAELVENFNLANGATDVISSLSNGSGLDKQMDPVDDDVDFFNNISTPKAAIPSLLEPYNDKTGFEESTVLQGEGNDDLPEEDENDRAIHNALVVGDFKGCVKHCLAVDRFSDAFIFARAGGSELWDETLKIYFEKHHRPYWKVFSAVVSHDIKHLVSSRPLNDWKGTLAMIFVYAGSEEFSLLCNSLAERLDTRNTHAAMLCYICAVNFEGLARLWYQEQLLKCNKASFIEELQEIIEQIFVLAFAKGDKHITPTLARLVTSYAELLIDQGMLAAAVDFLDLLPTEEFPEGFLLLKEHILKLKESNQSQLKGTLYPTPVQDWSQGSTQTANTNPSEELSYIATRQEASFSQPGVREASFSQPGVQEASFSQPRVQEASFSQPGVFYPTPADARNWSQPPPSAHPYVPWSAKSLYPSGVAPVPSPSQFFSSVPGVPPTQSGSNDKGIAPPDHNSLRDWANPSYRTPGPFQQAPVANQPVFSTPAQQGFMPVSAPRARLVQQQPWITTAPMEPQSPQISSPQKAPQAVVPAAPVTIQTVDISGVPDDLRPVIATLSRLYNETSEALGVAGAIPSKRREIDDNSKKIGGLFAKLNKSDISPNARGKLVEICQALDSGDYATASQLQMSLVSSDWDECGSWLGPLKRMIKTRQGLR